MKTFFVVVLAVVATTYATSVPLEGKSSDAANLDPVADTEGQIPVEVVYANQKDDEGSSTGGRRDKRFLFSKFLLAKAAFGAGAYSVVKPVPYWNVQKTWTPIQYNVVKAYNPAPAAWTWTKTYQPLPLPVATVSTSSSAAPAPYPPAASAAPAAAVASTSTNSAVAAPITYTWVKPFWPVVYKSYYGPAATVTASTGSTASTASTGTTSSAGTASTYAPVGGTVTLTKTYQPVAVTSTVTTS